MKAVPAACAADRIVSIGLRFEGALVSVPVEGATPEEVVMILRLVADSFESTGDLTLAVDWIETG